MKCYDSDASYDGLESLHGALVADALVGGDGLDVLPCKRVAADKLMHPNVKSWLYVCR